MSKVQTLIDAATPLLGRITLSRADRSAGTVAAAILSASGRVYTGICVSVDCGIGFCAEHAAVAEMLKARETEIDTVVAVGDAGVVAPCGRCRELMLQINARNCDAMVALPGGKSVPLRDLLPARWSDDRRDRDAR